MGGDFAYSYVSQVIGRVQLRKLPGNLEHDRLYFLVNLQGERTYVAPPENMPEKLAAFLENAWQTQHPVLLAGEIAVDGAGERWMLADTVASYSHAPQWYSVVDQKLEQERQLAREKASVQDKPKAQGTLKPGSRPLSPKEMKEIQELFSNAPVPGPSRKKP